MTDFDTVLERLIADPAFAASLAADPGAMLAGYRLSADERELLFSQMSGDLGGQTAVETRTNQSSVFGLLSPLTGLAGMADAAGLGQAGAAAMGPTGSGPVGVGVGQMYEANWDAGTSGFGEAGQQGFGPAPDAGTPGFGPAGAGGLASLGDTIGEPVTQAAPSASGAASADLPPPDGYRTRVDVDGDGDWDRHSLHGRAGGGVDIHVDLNRDGRVDFVGHDTNADGLVDSADYDKNRDGFFETHTYDDNGDGWMDRSRTERPPS